MKHIIKITSIVFGLSTLMLSMESSALMYWQAKVPNPESEQRSKVSQKNGHTHAGHGRREGKKVNLHQGDDAEVSLWLPTLVQRGVTKVDSVGNYTVAGTGLNNYHLLTAERHSENKTETAVRYLYMHGKPSGESPSLLIDYKKSKLEVIPSPLPREHWRYYGDRAYHFRVEFEGKPLTQAQIKVVTSNGSELNTSTDHQGMMVITLPDDFSDVKPGRRNNKPADFVMEVNHQFQQHQYVTTYSAPYSVNPSHWKIQWEGFAVMFIGFAGGLMFIQRVRREESQS